MRTLNVGSQLRLGKAFVACGVLAFAASANAVYSTSFENPPFTLGSIHNQDGWLNASGTGVSQSISDANARTGSQSLFWDNNANQQSFYSVRRALPGQNGAITGATPLMAEIWMTLDADVNRLYGLYLMNTSTSTLGGTNLGVTISGDGTVRGGTIWSQTYQNTGLVGTNANFVGNWIRVRLMYDGVGGALEVHEPISGATLGNTFAAVNLVNANGAGSFGINLGTDYFATTDRLGIAYMDDLNVQVVPEPATMSVMLLGAAALIARRRRKS